MVVCRRSRNGGGKHRDREVPGGQAESRPTLGGGGPVFLPRRRPSAIAETLLARAADDRVTAYDDAWFAGRPSTS